MHDKFNEIIRNDAQQPQNKPTKRVGQHRNEIEQQKAQVQAQTKAQRQIQPQRDHNRLGCQSSVE